jgi:hypothetical protein
MRIASHKMQTLGLLVFLRRVFRAFRNAVHIHPSIPMVSYVGRDTSWIPNLDAVRCTRLDVRYFFTRLINDSDYPNSYSCIGLLLESNNNRFAQHSNFFSSISNITNFRNGPKRSFRLNIKHEHHSLHDHRPALRPHETGRAMVRLGLPVASSACLASPKYVWHMRSRVQKVQSRMTTIETPRRRKMRQWRYSFCHTSTARRSGSDLRSRSHQCGRYLGAMLQRARSSPLSR